MTDLKQLSYKQFEMLVGKLLEADGYQITKAPGVHSVPGPDFEIISPTGQTVLVEVKHYPRGLIGASAVNRLVEDVERYRKFSPDAGGLAVLSGTPSPGAEQLLSRYPHIEVWSGKEIFARLDRHSKLKEIVEELRKNDDLLSLRSSASNVESIQAQTLINRLNRLAAGQDAWRDYEHLSVEILSYLFKPDLGTPAIQTRSDDGLDIMDAVFPIRAHNPPWSLVRQEFATRFVVAEFKNYSAPIGQKQVEAIAQYLLPKAQRRYGLLISRVSPSESAIKQRRRHWMEEGKFVTMLNDEHLVEMIGLKQAGRQPFEVIDALTESFLISLAT